MIHIDVEQGSKAWLDAKVGIPSASNFHRIITPKTLKPSAAADGYMHELLAERLLGQPLDDATTNFMQRGTIIEKKAREWYALQRDCDVEQVGFLLADDRRAGCSPDGLIGTAGGLEIKCPSAAVHVGYVLGELAEKYRCQIQGGLWITGAEYWDFVSYNPDLPNVLVRFERDEKFIAALANAVGEFAVAIEAAAAKLAHLGWMPRAADVARVA
jgi:hypothetical protein